MPVKIRPHLLALVATFALCCFVSLNSGDAAAPTPAPAPVTPAAVAPAATPATPAASASQGPATAPVAAAAAKGNSMQPGSLLEYYNAGGVLMHPILLCSIIGAAVVIERLIRLRRERIINDEIVDKVREDLLAGRKEQALSASQTDPKLCSFIIARALDDHIYTHATLEDALTEAGERHIEALSQRMSVIAVVIKVAPMLGLLGTVQGIIGAFGNMTGGEVVKEKMAHDIMVALITTFGGLSVAIPAIIAESYVRSIIRSRVGELEEIFISLVKADHIAGVNRAAGAKLDEPMEIIEDSPKAKLAKA